MRTSDETNVKIINLLERRKAKLANEPDQAVEPKVLLPDFVRPIDIANMNDEQLEALLNLVRVRRLTSTMIYERTQEEKTELRETRAKEQLEVKCEQVWKELDRTFKNLEKLEQKINEMRALRIQAGMQW